MFKNEKQLVTYQKGIVVYSVYYQFPLSRNLINLATRNAAMAIP
jgi:hypothetical protein